MYISETFSKLGTDVSWKLLDIIFRGTNWLYIHIHCLFFRLFL